MGSVCIYKIVTTTIIITVIVIFINSYHYHIYYHKIIIYSIIIIIIIVLLLLSLLLLLLSLLSLLLSLYQTVRWIFPKVCVYFKIAYIEGFCRAQTGGRLLSRVQCKYGITIRSGRTIPALQTSPGLNLSPNLYCTMSCYSIVILFLKHVCIFYDCILLAYSIQFNHRLKTMSFCWRLKLCVDMYRMDFPLSARSWWRRDKEILSVSPAFSEENHRSPMDILRKGPVILSFDIFYASPNKLLNIQSGCRWFETSMRLYDVTVTCMLLICFSVWWDIFAGG